MKASEWRRLLPIITAFASGQEIQYKSIDGSWTTASEDLESDIGFQLCPKVAYRIKPTDQWRAFQEGDTMPEQCMVRSKDLAHVKRWTFVVIHHPDRSLYENPQTRETFSYHYMFENYVAVSRFNDHIHPFGVKIESPNP